MQTNDTTVTEFILLGFTDHPKLQIPLFILFLLIYVIALLGNSGIILLTKIDAKLQTPMYFFLRNLSIVDIGYSTALAPRLLGTLMAKHLTISFVECAAQFFFFITFVVTEGCLLAVMAYDRFTAICSPLLYSVVMSKQFCTLLVVAAYACGFASATVHTIFIFSLNFCHSKNIINHFFCDVPPILQLSCSDTHTARLVHFIVSTVIALTTFVTVLISYIAIVVAILKMNSTQGRYKALSTCSSHLATVTIFFGTVIFMYIRPSSTSSEENDKIISLFYTLIISLLNPLIYSLRNKDVKDAVWRTLNMIIFLKQSWN